MPRVQSHPGPYVRVRAVTPAGDTAGRSAPARGWSAPSNEATTLILVRHGVTGLTERKAFSGSGGEDPELTAAGHEQAVRAADWLAARGEVDAVVTSPLRRTRQTAEHVAGRFGVRALVEEDLMETSFGDWDGFTFGEIRERWPAELTAWLASTDIAPPGGESFEEVATRVERARERLVSRFAGQTVVVVTHVSPIKLLVARALGAPIRSVYAMELAPASISTVAWWRDGNASLRAFNAVP
ncbi:histidine phosphatase family protein [Aeromicrobium piscarium]|uniref:Histidine phosphatase family protein n=1 Tax=Aeromicrobium piscarium TaxID=2590901 RepID=A0A554S921_9ACTN|nr:histidine phosphatase family protein [Aeromicrobium piscarium]